MRMLDDQQLIRNQILLALLGQAFLQVQSFCVVNPPKVAKFAARHNTAHFVGRQAIAFRRLSCSNHNGQATDSDGLPHPAYRAYAQSERYRSYALMARP